MIYMTLYRDATVRDSENHCSFSNVMYCINCSMQTVIITCARIKTLKACSPEIFNAIEVTINTVSLFLKYAYHLASVFLFKLDSYIFPGIFANPPFPKRHVFVLVPLLSLFMLSFVAQEECPRRLLRRRRRRWRRSRPPAAAGVPAAPLHCGWFQCSSATRAQK